jgi:Fe-S cluster biogenesis protein NfuA
LSEKVSQQRIQRIEELIRKFEDSADPNTRADARLLVQAIMEFHGAAVDRMMEIIVEDAATPDNEPPVFASFARDELVSSLLLLYGLHPVDLETRVAHALDKVRPILRAQSGNVHLLRIEGGDVHLKFEGKAAAHLKNAIEEEIHKAAADVTAIHIDGFESPHTNGLIQLTL